MQPVELKLKHQPLDFNLYLVRFRSSTFFFLREFSLDLLGTLLTWCLHHRGYFKPCLDRIVRHIGWVTIVIAFAPHSLTTRGRLPPT